MEIDDLDVAGYSLGARIAASLVDRGLRPGKLPLCGMGLEGLTDIAPGCAYFEDLILNGEESANPRAARAVRAMRQQAGMSAGVALNVMRSQVNTTLEGLAAFTPQTRIVAGTADRDNGDPAVIAAAIPNAELELATGDHLTTVSAPDFSDALVRFFDALPR
ncbi:MAG: alpha/beta fold hydrolase [Caulobacterales bacterium]